MERPRRRSHAQAGFSLVELLVVIVLIALLSLWGYPSLLATLAKLRLTNTAREAAVFMQIARMEAAKRSVSTTVIYQDAASAIIGKPSLLAFIDTNADGVYAVGERVLAGPTPLAPGIDLWGPDESAKEGASAIDVWTTGPTFSSNGSASSVGAFRFRDRGGNILETRIEFQGTGKVTIQKWFPADSEFYENGEAGKIWKWWS